MIIFTAEREIGMETHDLLGPELELAKAQQLCQNVENAYRDGKPLKWESFSSGMSWEAGGARGDYYVTKWEVE